MLNKLSMIERASPFIPRWRVRLEFLQASLSVATTVDERVTLAELVEHYLGMGGEELRGEAMAL